MAADVADDAIRQTGYVQLDASLFDDLGDGQASQEFNCGPLDAQRVQTCLLYTSDAADE